VTTLRPLHAPEQAVIGYLSNKSAAATPDGTGGLIVRDDPYTREALTRYLDMLRLRFQTIAMNVANANTIADESFLNNPYRRQTVGLDSNGPRVKADLSPLPRRYDPGHPLADASGFVRMPNVNIDEEMLDLQLALGEYRVVQGLLNTIAPTIKVPPPPADVTGRHF
jgi:flagellar basal-body rod protein FlgC